MLRAQRPKLLTPHDFVLLTSVGMLIMQESHIAQRSAPPLGFQSRQIDCIPTETKIENLMDNNLNDFFFFLPFVSIQIIFILGVITLLFFEILENDTPPKPEGKNNSFP